MNTLEHFYDDVSSRVVLTDAMGLTKSEDPLGRVTRYRRDADLHVTQLTDPLGRNTTFTYDLSGNVTSVTNPLGFVTSFAYGNGACPSCGGSQLAALSDPKGNIWTFGYDQYGRLSKTTNPLGQEKSYQYDKMSRVTEYKDPIGNVTTYTYTHDQNGNLTARTNRFDNSQFTYAYTTEQQLSEVTTPEHKVQYKYDPLGRRTSKTVDGRTLKFCWEKDLKHIWGSFILRRLVT